MSVSNIEVHADGRTQNTPLLISEIWIISLVNHWNHIAFFNSSKLILFHFSWKKLFRINKLVYKHGKKREEWMLHAFECILKDTM